MGVAPTRPLAHPGPEDRFTPPNRRRTLATVALLVGATFVIDGPLLEGVLPGGVVAWLRRNSEAWVFASLLLIGAWIVPRRLSHPVALVWWASMVGAFVATGVLGDRLGLSPDVVTLRECFAAMSVLTPYLRLTRRHGPPDRRTTVVALLVVTVGVLLRSIPAVAGSPVGQVIADHAETLAFLFLGVLMMDVVYRWPTGPDRVLPGRRVAWFATLAAVPVAVVLIERLASGLVLFPFSTQVTEAFLGVLLVSAWAEITLHLAVAPPGRWGVERPPGPDDERVPSNVPAA